ncbi:MAG: zinc-ribbon domain-containing protein [Christensenellales bacterium]
MKYCIKCGAQNDDNLLFCTKCGNRITQNSPENTQQRYDAPARPAAPYSPPVYPGAQVNKKSRKGMIIGVAAAVALIAAALVIFVWKPWADTALPSVDYSYLTQKKEIVVDYAATEKIYPNLYSTMDSVVNLTATCEGGDGNIMVRAEVVGFTQPYEQKVKVSEHITQLYIKPTVLTGDLDLWSSKDAQLVLSVTDIDSGEIIVQDSKTIKLMSIYDFILWEDEFGQYNFDNALAWLTPESEGILQLRRSAVDWMSNYSNGQFTSLAGYQLSSVWGADTKENNIIMQAVGLQAAMSEMGVRYNMGAYSMTEGLNQRVLLPDDVLLNGSGVCIETSLVMASALQSAEMHAMLIFPPGHAQVAVETWKDSGEYFLIETTLLPFAGTDEEIDKLVRYMNAEQWAAYLADPWGDGSGSCYVVDCNMATPLGITGLSN